MSSSAQTDRLTLIPLSIGLVLAPLALGTVHTAWVVVVWLFFALAFVLNYQTRRPSVVVRYSPLSLAMLLAAMVAAFQLVPLPPGLLSILSPSAHEIFTTSWLSAHGTAAPDVWRAISMDPMQTADRAMRFLTLFMAAAVVGNLNDRVQAWTWVSAALLIGAGLSLGIGLVHRAADMTLFYGIHESIVAPKLSTFISSNHAGSFFGVASITAFAISYRSMQLQKPQIVISTAIVGFVLFVASMDSDSAGASLVFLLAALVFVGVVAGPHMSRKVYSALATIGIVCVALLAATWESLLSSQLGRWVFDSADVRTELAAAALRASQDFWLSGSGLGSVDRVLYPYLDWTGIGAARIPTIENEFIEFFLTMGWPSAFGFVALILLTFLGVLSKPEETARRRFFRALLAASLVYLLGVGSMHFPFLALGVSLPIVVLAEASLRQLFRRHEPCDSSSLGYPFLNTSVSVNRLIAGVSIGLFCATLGAWMLYEVPEDVIPDSTSAEERDRLLVLLPSESQVFIHLTKLDVKKEDWKAALTHVERAYQLEPTPRFQLYFAFLQLQAEEPEPAIELYQQLGATRLAGRVAIDAAKFVSDPTQLADALSTMDPKLWRNAHNEVKKGRGNAAATELSLALVELFPDSPEAYELVVTSYWATKNFKIAELWARTLVLRRLPGTVSGYGLWIQSLEKQGLRPEAQKLAFEALALASEDPGVQAGVLRLKPTEVADATKIQIDQVELAQKLYCQPPISRTQRKTCLLSESWIAEAKGEQEEAERVLKQIYRSFKDARPLVSFYTRTRQCGAIRKVAVTLKRDDEAAQKALEASYQRCTQD